MSTIEVVEVVAPATWASALVNGDESSFDYHNDPTDRADYERFCAWLTEHRLTVVSTSEDEPWFTGSLPHSSYSGGDAITYICHRLEDA